MSNTIEIKLSLDLDNEDNQKKLSTFLKAIGGLELSSKEPEEDEPEEETEPKTRTRRRRTKAQIEAEKKQQAKEEEENEEEEEAEEVEKLAKPKRKLSEVQDKLSAMLEGDEDETVRAAAAKKLKELGAKKVSALEPENYDEFYNFLITLDLSL